MVVAATEAQSLFTRARDETEMRIMADERASFAARVRLWRQTPHLDAEPFGYRRALTSAESAEWRERTESTGGCAV
jgi:hypothetical protein